MEDKVKESCSEEQPKRFTYEQLEQIAGNLSNQLQQMNVRLQEANMFNTFKRLDYCFKVLELMPCNNFLSQEFVSRCAKEIEEMMTPPEVEYLPTIEDKAE